MEKKITLFHGSEKIIEYQTYLEMMDDETDGIYINKASAESLYKISKCLAARWRTCWKNRTAGTVRTVPAVFMGSACGGGRPKAPWAVPSIPEIHRVGGTGPRQIIGRGSRRWA